jgi:hypothetical protein
VSSASTCFRMFFWDSLLDAIGRERDTETESQKSSELREVDARSPAEYASRSSGNRSSTTFHDTVIVGRLDLAKK